MPKVRWINILSLGRRGLRTRIIIWFFVPTTLILVAVALVNYYAYQDVTEDLVIERDKDLTRLSASQLSTELEEYTDLLSAVGRTVERSGSDPDAQLGALKQAAGNLVVFDGGVVILNTFGRVVAADPERPGLLNQDWSGREYFRRMIRSSGPTFSNIHTTGSEEQEVIAVAVPITGAQNEFLGTVVGMFRLNPGAVSAFYGGILKLRIGESGRTYLVDGVGRVIHHPDTKQIGGDFSTQQVVHQVLDGQVGALRTRDFEGVDIVAGFAPIPGTPWGLVTEESWSALTSGGRGYQRFLLLLLALGIAVPAVVVAIGLRRIMHPIEDLIGAAREVARGNFGHTITARSRDEIGELSRQFNTMASALKESYAGLEKKVEERTHELRESEEQLVASLREKETLIAQVERRADQMGAINDVATQVGSILDLDELFPHVAGVLKETFNYYSVDIFVLEPESNFLAMKGRSGGYEEETPERPGINLGEGIVGWVAETGNHLLTNDVAQERRYLTMKHLPRDTRSELAVPILAGDQVVGVLNVESSELDSFDETDLSTFQTLGKTLGMAIENARLFQQTGDLAVLDERNRMAREIHDTLAQGLTGIILQLEAAEQAVDEGVGAVSDHLNRAKVLGRECLQEARRSVWGLVPQALEHKSLEAALQGEVHQFSATGTVKPSFTVSGERRNLSSEIQVALLRICQESLTNVRKHAEATEVAVDLVYSSGLVTLKVLDNGLGIHKDSATSSDGGGGFGITGMEQRAHQLGGTFSISNNTGRGALVEVKIPLG